jgi:hypothetical protein
MKLKLIISLLLSINLYSSQIDIFTSKDAENFEKNSRKEVLKLKNNFNINKDLNTFNKNKLNDFSLMISNSKEIETLNFVNSVYEGTPFISKQEGYKLAEILKKAKKYSDKPKEFILYFYSESVPKRSTLNILMNIDILRQNGINIESKQYMVGIPKDYKKYMYDWKDTIEEFPFKYRKMATNSFNMKLDLGFFKLLNIKKVPAMALAICESAVPEPKKCKIKYLIRGDVPLVTFFDKISLNDKKYLKYSQALNANGIIDINKLIKKEEVTRHEK